MSEENHEEGLIGTKSRRKQRKRQFIKLDPGLPFSHGVLLGDTLYLSGRIGLDKQTGRIPEDIETEVRNLMEEVRSILAKAGMTMDNLVYVQVFSTDVSLWEQFNSVYKTFFDHDYPARAFIGSGPLLFGAHFEIQGIAVRH